MFDVIIVANGISSRMGFDKLSHKLGQSMVISRTINCFENIAEIQKIILVSDQFSFENHNLITVKGGNTRTESVKCGLQHVTAKYVLIHDGARPFVPKDLILSIINTTKKQGNATPFLPIHDSIKMYKNGEFCAVDRDNFVTVQTPQGFETELIKKAYELSKNTIFTDDSEVFNKFIAPINLVEGEFTNKKITTADDLLNINAKVGTGFDVHKFCTGKKLMLGGINIPFEFGLEAHSDGDVVIHALMDALLSAIGYSGDIGVLFPDTDSKFANISSSILLKEVHKLLAQSNTKINNIAIVVIAQKPKISGFVPDMKKHLSDILQIDASIVSITATTTETLGIVGDNKGIACLAMVSAN